MTRTVRFARLVPALMALVAVTGCGDKRPRRVPVSGTVSYKNSALPQSEVIFIPQDNTKGIRARGRANDRGEFVLTTFDRDDGVVPGVYKVAVFAYKPGSGAPNASTRITSVGPPAIPERYFNHDSSGLTAVVPEEGATLHFDLKD